MGQLWRQGIKGLFRDITGDSKDVTLILDVFMIQQRAWECGGQGRGRIEGCVQNDKREQEEALIYQNTQGHQQSSMIAVGPGFCSRIGEKHCVRLSQVGMSIASRGPPGGRGPRDWRGQRPLGDIPLLSTIPTL